MSCLNTCSKCGRYYEYPKAFDAKLEDTCSHFEDISFTNRPSYSAIIKCSCGEQHVVGGELDAGILQTQGIMMFGRSYNAEYDAELDSFDAVMLVECEANDPAMSASTYGGSSLYSVVTDSPGRTIYLKPETIGRGLTTPDILDTSTSDRWSRFVRIVFNDQYPISPTGHLNRKLFKSWFKRNRQRCLKEFRHYENLSVNVVESEEVMLQLLNMIRGDVCIRTDLDRVFINTTGNNGSVTDWAELAVNQTGDVEFIIPRDNVAVV